MTKYKYSRSNRINKFIKDNNYSISPEETELFADLLSILPKEKECKHKFSSITGLCVKCDKEATSATGGNYSIPVNSKRVEPIEKLKLKEVVVPEELGDLLQYCFDIDNKLDEVIEHLTALEER